MYPDSWRPERVLKNYMDIYKAYSKNLRAIDKTLVYLSRSVKDHTRKKQDTAAVLLTRTYALMLGAWAECRLCKLLHMAGGFDMRNVDSIQRVKNIKNRWRRVIDTAFKKHYGVGRLTMRALGHTTHGRYIGVIEVTEKHIYPIIELRNKLAHGQFEYPLKNPPTDVSTELMGVLQTSNILSLQYKHQLLGHVIDLVECLVASKPAFERDFDLIYSKIQEVNERIDKADYQRYVSNLQSKHERGRVLR